MESGWAFDKFDDGSLKAAETNQLRKYGEFLSSFSHELDDLVDSVGGYSSSTWDSFLDPIELKYAPCEMSNLLGLVNTDNKIFNKIMVTLAADCSELQFLQHEAKTKFIPAVLYYGDGAPDVCYSEGKIPLQLGRFLPLMQNILCFVNRCNETIKHTMQQLSCLYAKSVGANKLFDVTDVHFLTVFQHIGNLLAVLITLDEVLSGHNVLFEDWELYKRILTSVKHDPTKYEFSLDKVKPFEKLLMTMEGKLMDSKIFQSCVEQTFEDASLGVFIRQNTMLAEYFTTAIRSLMSLLESRIEASDTLETNERLQFVGLCGLYALHFNLFNVMDKKLFKEIFAFHQKIPAVVLYVNVVWYPVDFLLSRLPHLAGHVDRKSLNRANARKESYLADKSGGFHKEMDNLYARATAWMIRMEGDFRRGTDLTQDLTTRTNLIIEGLHYAYRCKLLCRLVLSLHGALKRALTRSLMTLLCRGVEICKAIEAVFHRRTMFISESLTQILQHLISSAVQTIEIAKRRIINQSEKRYTERRLDILSALLLAQNALHGPATKERRLVVKLALAVGTPLGTLKDEEQEALNNLLRRIDVVADLWENIREGCDCSFMFTHRQTIYRLYVEDIYKNLDDVKRLQFMLCAMRDPVRGMMATRHKDSPVDVIRDYEKEITDILTECLLDPLGKEVETDLRLQIHSHLLQNAGDLNPFAPAPQPSASQPHQQRRDLAHFFKARPLRCFDTLVDIKSYVEHYLESTFYNLTTLSLHNWRTYGEMKKLAEQKYQLRMGELHLPSQTLEQGTDVLEIMRGMSDFSNAYMYNLNNQVFVQKASDNKHLNTVNIRHVANSIRTHGLGIMNTTVNNTYIFLKGRLFQFSEFLFDERVKGKILKEWHEYKEKHLDTDQMFPYLFAERLRRNMRKMHVYPDGTDPLERYRGHITRIGNAMAFVRLIRSGCLHCCSGAVSFLPDLEGDTGFEEMAQEDGLSELTKHSARNLDQVINNLTKNFARETDYFKMFVDVFGLEFRTKKNIHCRNFFILLPALTLSFVDHVINCKDRLSKKNKEGAAFTDDGFAMGVAFILKVLDLYKEFDSLHWFQSVSEHYRKEREKVERQLSTGRLDDKLRQTHTLTLRRLDQWQAEFDLLAYSMTSARIFFRADQTAAEEKAAQEGEQAQTEDQQTTEQKQ